MEDSLPGVLLLAGAGGVLLLWRWLSSVQARARGRLRRAVDNLESAIRAEERRRAELRFAELLLDNAPPAAFAPPAAPSSPGAPPAEGTYRPLLDDRVAWEK